MKNEEKQSRLRSRLYPRYDLEDSIKFIESLYKLGGSRVSVTALAADVGKAVNNSGFSGRVSSSKQFGLLTQDSGKLSVSSLGKEILVPRGTAEKNAAITTALSTPDLYKDLVGDFNGKVVPDIPTLANRLFHDYRIEAAAKDAAAKNFIRSAAFAGVLQNGILVVQGGDVVPVTEQGHEERAEFIQPAPPSGKLTPPVQLNGGTFQDNGVGWSVLIKSQKPLNSETKKKLIEVAELLDEINQ